eukprot:RCo019934
MLAGVDNTSGCDVIPLFSPCLVLSWGSCPSKAACSGALLDLPTSISFLLYALKAFCTVPRSLLLFLCWFLSCHLPLHIFSFVTISSCLVAFLHNLGSSTVLALHCAL